MHTDLDVDLGWLCERIVADAGEAVLFADADGVIRLWNEAAAEIFGYVPDEAVGASLDIIVPAEFRDPHWTGYEAALERGETTGDAVVDRTVVPALCADGSRITIETSGATVVTERSGEVVGVFNLIRDVTDRDV
jgi:PAS domain S-box-containing protein